MTKVAYLMPVNITGATGEMRLYKLDPPLVVTDWDDKNTIEVHEYVIVSATVVPFSGAETYIFPSDENGKITDWGELDGSFKGALDHEQALRNAGYDEITEYHEQIEEKT